MKPDRRQVRLTFPATGESVIAELLDDEAPHVCALVWKMLPVETKVIHGMYSGFEVFALECRKARWEGPQRLRIERVEG